MVDIQIWNEQNILHRYFLACGKSQDILKKMPENIIHTVVTSPPYWNLRDYFCKEQLGQEETPEEYINNLVSILREVKRVLRKDGTLWLNIGDSYNNTSGFCRASKEWKRDGRENGSSDKKSFNHPSIKKKDMVGMPWRVALALQNDGWFLRCDIIWQKTNPMPDGAKDRPTKAHEYLFLLTKAPKYFYDYYAGLEKTDEQPEEIQGFGAKDQQGTFRQDQNRTFEHYGKRNKRSVWTTSVSSFAGEHFATYPPSLIKPCIAVSTSEKGCCKICGKPWVRIIEKVKKEANNSKGYTLELESKGWEKDCKCDTNEVSRCIVLDPFNGTGTTGEVAMSYWNHYIGIDISQSYINVSQHRFNSYMDNYRIEVNHIEDIYGK